MFHSLLISLFLCPTWAQEDVPAPSSNEEITIVEEMKTMQDSSPTRLDGMPLDPEGQPWEMVHHERREAKTEEEIRTLFSTFRDEFKNDKPEETEFAAVEITQWKWTYPTVCPPGDPRLQRESIEVEIRLKPVDGKSIGAGSGSSAGMSYSDPCK